MLLSRITDSFKNCITMRLCTLHVEKKNRIGLEIAIEWRTWHLALFLRGFGAIFHPSLQGTSYSSPLITDILTKPRHISLCKESVFHSINAVGAIFVIQKTYLIYLRIQFCERKYLSHLRLQMNTISKVCLPFFTMPCSRDYFDKEGSPR